MANNTDVTYGNRFISLIVPVYNEEETLIEFHRRLINVLDSNSITAEIIYVNDASTDGSLRIMQNLREEDYRVGIIDLSRNFGKEIAMSAGLDYASGDGVVVIDADLQDPPELIPELIKHWQDGYDVVYCKRIQRKGESVIKRSCAYVFYRLIQKVTQIRIPEDTGDYRLISRRAVDSLKELKEQHRFMKGLFSWIGYSQKEVPYNREPRYAGETKWTYWRLWNFALEGITSFTSAPLKLSTYLGVITALGGFLYALFIVCKKIFYGDPVKGFPTLIVIITILGGVQLLSLGLIGEYLGRMFDETKRRPLYFVNHYEPSSFSTTTWLAAGPSKEESGS